MYKQRQTWEQPNLVGRESPILRLLAPLLALTLALAPGCGGPVAEGSRPNIVLIVADDLGFSDLGSYGGEIHTPNLDRLAAGGLRFSQFYNNAICDKSRASLLSGLYSQQVGGRRMENSVTLAEVLRSAGYRTLMTGKWHLDQTPLERGFDRYFGLLDGTCNCFNPGVQRPDEPAPGVKSTGSLARFAIDDKVIHPFTPEDKNFYTTDTFTDYALDYLDQYGQEEPPFFLYIAHNVPHYPLQAWPEDIARYRGRYKAGWDELREQRLKRMVRMGLIPSEWGLSDRSPHAPAWDLIEDQDAWDTKMAVYAAMVDRMDQNIGRVLEKIRQLGKERNTLVLFLSDNGPSDEDRTSTPNIPRGPVESYRSVDLPWANLSNTPFRQFKRWNHEGGISTPLIAYWPDGIKNGGSINHEIGHLIDIMATVIEIADAEYPTSYEGRKVTPLEGKSLAMTLQGEQRPGHDALFWNQQGLWRAVRMGNWKLVSPDHSIQYNPWRADRIGREIEEPPTAPHSLWELYDLETDRTEQTNLAQKYPDRVREMIEIYEAWEDRVLGHNEQ